jgi:hypothetical protein
MAWRKNLQSNGKKDSRLNYGVKTNLTYIMVKRVWHGEKISSQMVKKFLDLIMVKMASGHISW